MTRGIEITQGTARVEVEPNADGRVVGRAGASPYYVPHDLLRATARALLAMKQPELAASVEALLDD